MSAVVDRVHNAVVIEPSEPDRYWMRMTISETGIPHSLREFPTCIHALDALGSVEAPAVDLVFITVAPADLSIAEAVLHLSRLPALKRARFVVTIVDKSEIIRVPAGCHSIMKPANPEDIRGIVFAADKPDLAGRHTGPP